MLWLMTEGGQLMPMLLVGSVLAIAFFLERMFHYHRAQINAVDFIHGIQNILQRGNINESLSLCDETPGPVAEVVKTAVQNRDRHRDELREAIQDVARSEVARLEKNLVVLATIAQVAPLLGFLGTVIGMIETFQVIQSEQLPNAGELVGGIWEALLTTAAGLAIAIPTYIGYNFLVSRVKTIVLDMEQAANDIVTYLTHHGSTVPPADDAPPTISLQ